MVDNSVYNISTTSLTLGAVIARGANGVTLYKADLIQGQHSFQVAVKSFSIAGASASAEADFIKEVQIAQLASATCQRACRMLGCCKLDGNPCLIMSLYQSCAAKVLAALQGPLDISEVVKMGVEILEGLIELHAVNVWHLDLKPANILLDKHGHAYLSDFGISHALQTLQSCTALTACAGTPHYLAPEQADADFGSRGPHTDVWGFATTMLHLATGHVPYAGLTQVQILTAMLKQRSPAVPDNLPAWLAQLLRQCLTFNIAQRPLVSQLLQAFQQQLQQNNHLSSQDASGGVSHPGAAVVVQHRQQVSSQDDHVEEKKQTTIRRLLNNISAASFDKVLQEILDVGYETTQTVSGLVNQVCEKAVTDTNLCGICAQLCFHLNAKLPSFEPEAQNGKKLPTTFRKLLLNSCQELYEKTCEATQEVANKNTSKSNEDEDEAQQQALGTFEFMGYLYCQKMLTEKILHESIKKLLSDVAAPKQINMECLSKLMSVVGSQIDNPNSKKSQMYINAYFERIRLFSKTSSLGNETRLMLQARGFGHLLG